MSSEDLIIRQYRNRIRKKVLSTMLVGLILSVLVFLDIQVGSSSIAFKDLVDAVLKGRAGGSSASFIVWEIRLPMTFTCLFVGASLSLAGLLIQTITNNPLASPYTLGVTAGASFGAAIAITTGFALFGQIWLGVSLAALVMALTVSAFIFYLGSKRSLTATTLILVGVIMNFFFQALQQYLQYRASPEIAQIISGWTFGNLQRSSWISAGVSSACWTIVLLISFCYSWKLTALSDGTERARGLGITGSIIPMASIVSIPAIGSTIPDNTPYTKALSFELPVLCNGMDMIAPSGKFCMAIPIASERAAALVMVVVPDIQLA